MLAIQQLMPSFLKIFKITCSYASVLIRCRGVIASGNDSVAALTLLVGKDTYTEQQELDLKSIDERSHTIACIQKRLPCC